MSEIAVKLATAAGEQLVGELSLLVGVREEIQDVISELRMLHAFLRDAEEKQVSNETVRVWLKEMRMLAYMVEDYLDDFSIHLGRRHRGNHLTSLARLVCSLQYWTARHRIAIQIQNIKHRVENVKNMRISYGITSSAASITEDYADSDVRKYDPRLSALFVEDSQLVGIEGHLEKLVGWLLDETEPELSIIAVVGGGGLGKTTIVKKAYDNPNVTGGHFNCRAWITVSQTYNVDGIIRDILKQLIPTKDSSSMERVQLIEELKGHLEQKRYIIIFDDVWKINTWKILEMALPKNEFGSRILLTTRNMELAETACATPNIHGRIYRHNELTPEDSMELFLRRVFNYPEEKVCPKDLEGLTRAILEKCNGLPLAIISIAGVLASKPNKSKQKWEKLMERLGSELEHNPNLKGMSHILALSYNDLPYHVRHCFLYLSKFSEDYLIKRKRIQRLWIAEGFVSGCHDMTAEEVAESYFNELANRFMIIPSQFNSNGKVRWFKVHDIMLELIVSKSREESFLSLITGNKDNWMITRDVIRRLSVHDTKQHVEENLSLSHVWSLTIHKDVMPTLISPLFGMLRVLDLEGCAGLRNRHIKTVAKLFHLKYLSLRDSGVDELPGCLKRLGKLETLDIRGTSIGKLPKGIIKLQQLRFLNGRGGGLIMPKGIGRLRALHVLVGVDAKRSGKQVIKELRNLTQLQKLVVLELSEDLINDFCDSLTALSGSLRSLEVAAPVTSEGLFKLHARLQGLSSISEPPLLLESLCIEGELKQLPTWVLSLSNLVKMRLSRSNLKEDAIQSLGTLPNLNQLTLMREAVEGKSLCFGAQGFPRLKELLLLFHYTTVKAVSFQGGAMCQLDRVTIWCRTARMRILGITNLPSLKELRACMKNEDLEEVKAQLNQHPNRPTLTTS